MQLSAQEELQALNHDEHAACCIWGLVLIHAVPTSSDQRPSDGEPLIHEMLTDVLSDVQPSIDRM